MHTYRKKWTRKPFIITITGTKGKTTVSRGLSFIFQQRAFPTMRVDTDGTYKNERHIQTLRDSVRLHSLFPTVCPGKHLSIIKDAQYGVAVLEASLSSYKFGLGYWKHHIGIFTNIFEDHIDDEQVRSKKDLAEMKSFIIKQVHNEGTLIFNADDAYVSRQIRKYTSNIKAYLLPVGRNFKYYNIEDHIKGGGRIITEENGWIGVKSDKSFQKIVHVNDISWTYQGLYLPSVYNTMFIVGALYAENNFKKLSSEVIDLVKKYQPSSVGGRLIEVYDASKDIRVIIDYAHEKQSIKKIGELANKIKKGRSIGVIRLAPNRTNTLIQETGHAIANTFDTSIVYDKIDGVKNKVYGKKGQRYYRKTGEVAQLLFASIKEQKKNSNNVYKVLEEKKALQKAIEKAQRGDIIVHISDDHALIKKEARKLLKNKKFVD